MTTQKVPALGQAWLGDWRARVLERVCARGFSSVTAFADVHPTLPMLSLAAELSTDLKAKIDLSDVAADQVVQVWRDEASRSGAAAIERFARRLLVGELHERLTDGWRSDWRSEEARSAMERMSSIMSNWICDMRDEEQAWARHVFNALLARGSDGTIPTGWLPSSADDPLLIEIFRLHWREQT